MTDDDSGAAQVAGGQLRAIVERIERLEEEKAEVGEQIKEVYAEAKGNGFDTKTLRRVIALRKKKPEERSEEAAMLDLYSHALGMQPTLEHWAEAQDGGSRRLRKAAEQFGVEPAGAAPKPGKGGGKTRNAKGGPNPDLSPEAQAWADGQAEAE